MQSKLYELNSKNGLPNEQIHNISFDKYQRIWMAGPAGLSCYNGSKLKVYDARNGLKCPGLRTVYIQKEDIIWIGTDRGIEALNIKGNAIEIQLDFEWTFGIAECFYCDGKNLWVGTSFGLLKLNYKPETAELSLISQFDTGLVHQIISISEKKFIFISAINGVQLVNLTGKKPKLTTILKDFDVKVFYKELYGDLIIGTNKGIFILNPDFSVQNSFLPEGSNTNIKALLQVNNITYFSIYNTFYAIQKKANKFEQLEKIEVSSIINQISIDSYHNIWISTNNSGLLRLSEIRKGIQKIDTGILKTAFCINRIDQDSKLEIGGAGFTSTLDADHNLKLLNVTGLDTIVWDVKEDPIHKNYYYFATQDGLFYARRKHKPILDSRFSDVITGPNRILLVRGKELWVGTIAGLFCITEDTITEILRGDGNRFGYVYCLELNSKNEILLGSLGQGLWKEIDGAFINIVNDILSKETNTYSVKYNAKNNTTLVIQQEKVIVLHEDLSAELIWEEHPLAGWTSTWIDETRIAVGSSDGLCIIDTVTKQLISRINLHLDKSEWQFTSTMSLFLYDNHTLLCGLNSGLFKIDLNKIEKLNNAPKILIDEITWANGTPKQNQNYYSIQTGKWSFEVSVYSCWYVDESQIQYRFKLVGFDEDWLETKNINEIKYSSLPVGKYELLVQSFTPLTGYGETKCLIYIDVQHEMTSNWSQMKKIVGNWVKKKNSTHLKNEFLIQQNQLLQNQVEERKKVEGALLEYKRQLENTVETRTKDLLLEKERAESADKMKSIFLATMSHEIRTPLGGIIGLNNMILESGLTDTQLEYANKINFSADHLLQIINDILDITKIETGQLELEKVPFSLFQFVEDVAEFSQIKSDDKDIDIVFNCDLNQDVILVGDVFRLKQVLINLIGNAIKFTETGVITVNVNLLSEKDNTKSIKFSVADNGIGISEEQQKDIFSAFNQGDSDIARKYGGSGLGLNISKNFIELMGGNIQLTSTLGQGSDFYFVLSFPTDKEAHNLKVIPEKFNNDKAIIIIENDKIYKSLSAQLNTLGIQSWQASTANEVSNLINNGHTNWNLIIVDVELESLLTGIENNSQLKVIGLGGNSAQINAYKKHPLISNLILKPVTVIKLANKIKQVKEKEIELSINQPITPITNQEQKPESGVESFTEKVLNILVAEDNEINQMIINKQLSDLGHHLTIVNNGQECISMLEVNPNFDLIFMDIQMPIMDGISATKHIRAHLELVKAPIIALTADVTVDTQNSILDYGMNDYLPKPYKKEAMLKMLGKWKK